MKKLLRIEIEFRRPPLLAAAGLLAAINLAPLAYGDETPPVPIDLPADSGLGAWGVGACMVGASKPRPAVTLFVRNPLVEWHGAHRRPVPLAEIGVPGSIPRLITDSVPNQVSRRFTVLGATGETAGGLPLQADSGDNEECELLHCTISRLSPVMLISLPGSMSVELAAGSNPMARWSWGHLPSKTLVFNELDRRAQAGIQLRKPSASGCYAVRGEAGVRAGTLDPDGFEMNDDDRWLLLWWGEKSGFDKWYSPDLTMDVPLLLVFSHPPWIEAESGIPGGPPLSVRFSFAEAGARIVVLPLAGHRFTAAADTAEWNKTLPEKIVARCDWWAERLHEFPFSVSEVPAYDEPSDVVRLDSSFEFIPILPGGTRFCPLPPMLELARRKGFAADVSAPVVDAQMNTYCGPLAGVEAADGYTLSVQGLRRYAQARREIGPPPADPPPLYKRAQARFLKEITAMLDAGHLATVNLPRKIAWSWNAFHLSSERHFFYSSQQTLVTLAEALPLLDEPLRGRVLDYMIREREQYPPEVIAHQPSNQGARREPWQLPQWFIEEQTNVNRDRNHHVKTQTAPAESLYALARFYESAGSERMRDNGFVFSDAMNATLMPWLERADWATAGWISWPMELRDFCYSGHYAWNQMHEANRQIAAVVGLVRLARMLGNEEWERRGMGCLARALIHRFALGKYMGWFYEQGMMRGVPGFDPARDVRQVTMSEQDVYYDYAYAQQGVNPYHPAVAGPFACVYPETALFFADRLRSECEMQVRETAVYYPDVYMAFASPRTPQEWWLNSPDDSMQVFMIRSCIMRADGDWLYRHLDVPWFKAGDLYYIQKLIETLTAYRGWQWAEYR